MMQDAPSTGIPWADAVIRAFRSDPWGGFSPMPMATSIVGPGARRGLQFVAEQAAERIPGPSRAKLAELLGRSANIRPMAHPAAELPSAVARTRGAIGDVNMPQIVADAMEAGGRDHYMRLLNQVLKQRNPVVQNADQAGVYELLLLELLGGRLP